MGVVGPNFRGEGDGIGEESHLQPTLPFLVAVPDHVVDKARKKHLDSLGMPGALLDEILESSQRPRLVLHGDHLRLLRFEVGLAAGFQGFKLFPLGFQGLELVAKAGHDVLPTFGDRVGKARELGPDASQPLPRPFQVLLQLAESVGLEFLGLCSEGLKALRLEPKFLQKLEDGMIEGLRRDVPPRTGTPDRLLRADAGVVGVVEAVAAGPGLRRHLVGAVSAAKDPLEQVDVLVWLALGTPVALAVPVHQLLDLKVDLPGPDGLPLAVPELALVLLLSAIDLVAEHPADDWLGVEGAAGCAVAALAELLDDGVAAFLVEVDRVHLAYMRRVRLLELEHLVLHLVADGRRTQGKSLLRPPLHLVLHAGGRRLPLELGEEYHQADEHPSGGRREVEVLAEGDNLDVVAMEFLDQLKEVDHAAGDAIELGDHDHVDEPTSSQLKELLKLRSLSVLGALAVAHPVLLAFHEPFGDRPIEALRALVVHEGVEAIELGVERAVLLLRLPVGRHSYVERDVDGALLG